MDGICGACGGSGHNALANAMDEAVWILLQVINKFRTAEPNNAADVILKHLCGRHPSYALGPDISDCCAATDMLFGDAGLLAIRATCEICKGTGETQ